MRNKKLHLLNKIKEEFSAELKNLISSRTFRVYIEHEDHFSDDYETTMNLSEIADYDGSVLWTQLYVYEDKRIYQADFVMNHKKEIMVFKKICKKIEKNIKSISDMISFYEKYTATMSLRWVSRRELRQILN